MITVTIKTSTTTIITNLGNVWGLDRRYTIDQQLYVYSGQYYAADAVPLDATPEHVMECGFVQTVTLTPASERDNPQSIPLAMAYGLDDAVILCLCSEGGLVAIVGGMTYEDALDDAADNDLMLRWEVAPEQYEENHDWYTPLGGYGTYYDLGDYFAVDTCTRDKC